MQIFVCTTEIMEAMRDMFRNALQQIMESQLDAELGSEKSQRQSRTAADFALGDYRNRYFKMTVKPQLVEVDIIAY